MTNDKMQELRLEMAEKSLADVRSIIEDFDRQTGRSTSINGGGVYVWDVVIRHDWSTKTKDVEVKFDIANDLDSEAVELAWDIERIWNGWMLVINLLDKERDEAWTDHEWEFGDEIGDAISKYLSKAISDTADAIKRWLGSAQDLPWDMEDDEVLEYMTDKAQR